MAAEAFDIVQMLRRAVTARIAEIIEEEVADASGRVRARIRAETDALALSILATYSVEQKRDEITIRVNKKGLES